MFSSATKSAAPAGGYTLSKSLRFRSSASAYMNRTVSSNGSAQKATFSVWVKRGALSTPQVLFNHTGVSEPLLLYIDDSSSTNIVSLTTATYYATTSAVLRDTSAWYHIVFAIDTTQATASNRFIIYINGVQQTALATTNYPPQNTNIGMNQSTYIATLGRRQIATPDRYLDGYLAEAYWIDGQQLTPSSFGSTNGATGVWQPKAYTGTYGTNGFYLPFTNTTSTTTLGNDFSGNGNNFTTNNFSLTTGVNYDSMNDVPTLTSSTIGNYCVINPLTTYTISGAFTLTNGNLNYSTSLGAVDTRFARGSIAVSSGKWYWEITPTNTSTDSTGTIFGIINATQSASNSGAATNITSSGYGYIKNGNKLNGSTSAAYGASYTNNDVIGVALDMDAGTLTFYKNNVSQGTAYTGLSGSFLPLIAYSNSAGSTTYAGYANFGQRAFVYSAPSGYLPLNTYNLSTSTIVKGNTEMDATLYSGNSSTQVITNAASFQPDLVWIKSRSAATDNKLTDSVRGATKALVSNSTAGETTDSTGLTAFNSNGFTLGSSATYNNGTGPATYVGWQWQAGQNTTTVNTSGTITSNVSVNTSSGFGIVTYTGTGANATVGHGLGVAPQLMIIKSRTEVKSWAVYHVSIGATNWLQLEQTSASTASATVFNNTAPSSSVFSIGTATVTNNTGQNYVAYCWTPIAGFSAFGSYTGNANASGPFIYTGFRPKFILIKNASDATSNWKMFDTTRSPYNVMGVTIYPNSAGAELTGTFYDALSNGFKVRSTGIAENGSGNTIIYAAFAENPFKYALAR